MSLLIETSPLLLYKPKHLLFYFTSLAFQLITNLWQANLGSIPSISSCDQASISKRGPKDSTNFSLKIFPNLNSIFINVFKVIFFALIASRFSACFYLPFFESPPVLNEVICMTSLAAIV